MTNAGKRHAAELVNTTRADPRLRVLIASSQPFTAAGLEALLRAHTDLEIIVSSSGPAYLENTIHDIDPDVLILDVDEYESASGNDFGLLTRLARMVPIVGLVLDPSVMWITQALQAGIRGLLPHGTPGDELASAVRALASGLVVLSPELSDIMLSHQIPLDSGELHSVVESLTPREHQVLVMVAEGLFNKEIADRLRISEHTVKFHISSIMSKLGASSRTEAVTQGLRRGLVFL